MPPFHFIMVVWGERFTRFFLDVTLPSQLAPDGLPAMRRLDGAMYRLFTTARDAQTIAASLTFARLSSLMAVEFVVVAPGAESLMTGDPYAVMTAFHRRAVAEASACAACLVFLAPDAVFSSGAFAYLERRAELGDEMVMIAAPRAAIEGAAPVILDRFRRPDGTISVPAPDLVRLMIDHPHPIARAARWGTPEFCGSEPSHLYVMAGKDAFVAHCWHLHPVLVRARPDTTDFSQSIDGDYVLCTVRDPGRVHVVTSSDDVCAMELSRRDHLSERIATPGPYDRERLTEWIAARTNRLHRGFFRRPVVFRTREADGTLVDACLAEAASVAGDLGALAAEIADPDCIFNVRALAGVAHLYLYGCGRFGQSVLALLRRSGVAATAFIDSERAGECDGLPVLPFAAFRDDHPAGAVVLICSMFYTPIAQRLESVPDCRVLSALPLFEQHERGDLMELPLMVWNPRHLPGETP